jgi:hypothetical protein
MAKNIAIRVFEIYCQPALRTNLNAMVDGC